MSVIVRDLRELQSVYLVGIWCVWNRLAVLNPAFIVPQHYALFSQLADDF